MNLLGGRTAIVLSSILVVLGLVVRRRDRRRRRGARLPPRRAARPRGRAPPLPGEARWQEATRPRPRPRRPLARQRSPTARSARRSSSRSASSPCTQARSAVGAPRGRNPVLLLVALSYAEGSPRSPRRAAARCFARRAFNDPAGFLTGWLLLLDYVVVIALAALFVPHYAGAAFGWDAIADEPWDGIVGVGVIAAVAVVRLVRRSAHVPHRARRRGAVVRDTARPRRPRIVLRLRSGRSRRHGTGLRGCRSLRACRSRRSPTPGSRRSRTTRRDARAGAHAAASLFGGARGRRRRGRVPCGRLVWPLGPGLGPNGRRAARSAWPSAPAAGSPRAPSSTGLRGVAGRSGASSCSSPR